MLARVCTRRGWTPSLSGGFVPLTELDRLCSEPRRRARACAAGARARGARRARRAAPAATAGRPRGSGRRSAAGSSTSLDRASNSGAPGGRTGAPARRPVWRRRLRARGGCSAPLPPSRASRRAPSATPSLASERRGGHRAPRPRKRRGGHQAPGSTTLSQTMRCSACKRWRWGGREGGRDGGGGACSSSSSSRSWAGARRKEPKAIERGLAAAIERRLGRAARWAGLAHRVKRRGAPRRPVKRILRRRAQQAPPPPPSRAQRTTQRVSLSGATQHVYREGGSLLHDSRTERLGRFGDQKRAESSSLRSTR